MVPSIQLFLEGQLQASLVRGQRVAPEGLDEAAPPAAEGVGSCRLFHPPPEGLLPPVLLLAWEAVLTRGGPARSGEGLCSFGLLGVRLGSPALMNWRRRRP